MESTSEGRRTPQASLGRAVLVYAGVSYAILERTGTFVDGLGLPGWTFPTVATLLVAGFPIVAATAWISASRRTDRRSGASAEPLHRRLLTWRNVAVAAVLVFALVGVGQTMFWLADAALGQTESEWAREVGIAQLRAYAEADDAVSGYPIALRLASALPDDSLVARLVDWAAPVGTIESTPPGAKVYARPWAADGDGEWDSLGITPLEVRVPAYWRQYRFELAGHEDTWRGSRSRRVSVELFSSEGARGRFVQVRDRINEVLILGLEHVRPPEELPPFQIAAYEVTNEEYHDFVSGGAYADESLWLETFVEDGRVVEWSTAMARFVDRSGRPGPSTWVAGDYPDGTEHLPVGGISWYEAAAYAHWAGGALPTVWHWTFAATPRRTDLILPRANISTAGGSLPVGASGSMSSYGVFDMAGNVREWVANANSAAGGRYLLGGGWDDPPYAFTDAEAYSEWDRSETNGFRLARMGDPTLAPLIDAAAPIASPRRDLRSEVPVSDEVFQAYRALYSYDPTALNKATESRDSTADYLVEHVEIDAAYGGERLPIVVYRPVGGEPPFQTVLYFPGAGVLQRQSSSPEEGYVDFIVKSGRAVVSPVFAGTLERGGGRESDWPSETTRFRNNMVKWVLDVHRAIEFIQREDDLDSRLLGYFGFSWGADLAGIVLAMSPDFVAAVLASGGIPFQRALPEVEAINYLPRVEIPVLMVNGEYDFYFPVATSQRPMFDLLGTPDSLKHHVVVPGTHLVPVEDLAREALTWLDRYMGPVRR